MSLGLALAFAIAQPTGILAQPADDAIRVGLSFGGISTVGVNVEFFRGSRSLELSLGTWSFRDISFSASGKKYVGSHAVRPFVGAGLWMVIAAPGDERTGLALVLRAPVGVDWSVTDSHAVGAELGLSRALWVRRSDPADDLPMNKRIVPLPGLYYRFAR